jgi:DNA-binding PadR family transcriptional regulator
LTERLNHLVEQGVVERRPYDRRPRFEYALTEKGTELVDLLMVMVGWGDKWLAGQAGPGRAAGALPPQVVRQDQPCRPALRPLRAADARWRRRDTSGTGRIDLTHQRPL